MVKRGWKGILLVTTAVVGLLSLRSVRGIDEAHVKMETIEEGSIDVVGTQVSFLGNLGRSPSSPTGEEAGAVRNVLLLHGAKFSAQTWQDLGTLSLLATNGFRVAAVNLPTREMTTPRDELLELICSGLGMGVDSPAVIVSPSMSGSFSVPLLLRKPELFAGYVPVAPGEALSHTAEDFAAVTGVPALIVYGELDRMGSRASSLLSSIPGSRVLMVPGASHPCYIDEPDMFHESLLSFLNEDAHFSRAR
ncbi:unnamed protein product [Ectocarpus sp. 4 AP-2014]